MIGRSPAFQAAMRLVMRIASCSEPVVIEGETGTGKEMAARAIHYNSARSGRPFVPVNCGALPDALIENELFGHRRGAFTDAKDDFPGLLRLAQGGTLFLDEVDALTAKAQVTLLRFLQDQRFRPLGGTAEESADVRIMAAANRPLVDLTEQGLFRTDLLYRLRVMLLRLPPLRERRGDPELLAWHFVRRISERYGTAKRLHPLTLSWLDRYRWPGNVRELENLISREFVLAENDEIVFTGDDAKRASPSSPAAHTRETYRALRAQALAAFDVDFLRTVLGRCGGNVTRAARDCGKERRAFGRLLKKYGIEPRDYC